MNKTLRMQIKIKASYQDVYKALTESSAVKVWFSEHADIDMEQRRYDFWGCFTPGTPDQIAGQHPITAVEVNRLIKYEWLAKDIETTVTYKVLDQGDETVLTVLHDRTTSGDDQNVSLNFEDFWFLSLENLRRYAEGRPVSNRYDFNNSNFGDIHVVTDVDAPADTVFDVLTNPKQMERWIAHKATIEPKVGGVYDYGWKGVEGLKIVEIEENKKLVVLWPEGEAETVLSWTLEESDGKTRMTLVQSGFAKDYPTGGIKTGWTNFMNWVRSISEIGEVWQPPIYPLVEANRTYYPASMVALQSELIETEGELA